MKEDQLRIGSLVRSGIEIYTVSFIGLAGVECLLDEDANLIPADSTKIEPIQITPTILEQCGFELWNDDEGVKEYVLHNVVDGTSNFKVFIVDYLTEFEYVEYGIDNEDRMGPIDSEYLHVLQNIFLAFVGHDLTWTTKLTKTTNTPS